MLNMLAPLLVNRTTPLLFDLLVRIIVRIVPTTITLIHQDTTALRAQTLYRFLRHSNDSDPPLTNAWQSLNIDRTPSDNGFASADDEHSFYIHILRANRFDRLVNLTHPLNARARHVLLLDPFDVEHLDVSDWLQTSRLNGIIVVWPANAQQQSNVTLHVWNRFQHRIRILYPITELELFGHSDAGIIFFDRNVRADSLANIELYILTDLQLNKALNVSNSDGSRCAYVGVEFSFGNLLAKRLGTRSHGKIFKWSCIVYENSVYTAATTVEIELPFRLRTFDMVRRQLDDAVAADALCDASAVDAFLPNNHALLLQDTLSDRYATGVYPHAMQRAVILVPTERHSAGRIEALGETFETVGFVATAAVLLAAIAWLRCGLQRCARWLLDGSGNGIRRRHRRSKGFVHVYFETVGMALSVSMPTGVGEILRSERVVVLMVSLVALLIGMLFSGIFIQGLMFSTWVNIETIVQLRDEAQLPVMLSLEFSETADWWREE